MARDGAICVKSYRETGLRRDAGSLPAPSVEMIRAVVAAAHAPSHARVPARELEAGAGLRGGGGR